MESVFRFNLVRPGIAADGAIRVALSRTSQFQTALLGARAGAGARAQMLAMANAYVAAPGIARDYAAYALGTAWSGLASYLQTTPPPKLADVKARIHALFGQAPDVLIGDAKFTADDVRAADSVLAVRMVKAEQPAGYGVTPTVVRLAQLIRALAGNQPNVVPGDVLGWVLVMPPGLFPLPNAERTTVPPPPDPTGGQIAALTSQLVASKSALEELMNLEATTSTVEDDFGPPILIARTGLAPMPIS